MFTDDWLAPLHKRFARRRPYQTEYAYLVATAPQTAERRREIEKWVAQLDEREQALLIPRLRSSENHDQTYHELAVGALLREAGTSVRYEEPLDGGPGPDWSVRDASGQLLMAVEVLTANPSPEVTQWQHAISEVIKRLDTIPVGLALGMRVDYSKRPPDQRLLKNIEEEVRRWLAPGRPPLGSSIKISSVTLRVLAESPNPTGIKVVGAARAFRPDCSGLARRVSNKVRKYTAVTAKHKLPLVVAIVSSPATGFNAEAVGHILHPECERLFAELHELSAIFYAERDSGVWRMTAYRNLHASIPLAWYDPPGWQVVSNVQ